MTAPVSMPHSVCETSFAHEDPSGKNLVPTAIQPSAETTKGTADLTNDVRAMLFEAGSPIASANASCTQVSFPDLWENA